MRSLFKSRASLKSNPELWSLIPPTPNPLPLTWEPPPPTCAGSLLSPWRWLENRFTVARRLETEPLLSSYMYFSELIFLECFGECTYRISYRILFPVMCIESGATASTLLFNFLWMYNTYRISYRIIFPVMCIESGATASTLLFFFLWMYNTYMISCRILFPVM